LYRYIVALSTAAGRAAVKAAEDEAAARAWVNAMRRAGGDVPSYSGRHVLAAAANASAAAAEAAVAGAVHVAFSR
jgi:hypothetical protein